ncbi:MAG: transporter substrate-binding domain-containing protein [Proteobacteria bacterium]|nr:transporter substrate-binding domain-containing protein [Pseudomonadota bacterium]MBU1583192.1 transporter substrate-binding domain-containing protein [Pseudomonadota bacterium]MBU2451954.1 transporter substrate-binding domain-containing protein [Pseudomonadota bacterium]MBU2631282.1 transporter substrate-binding domain-containing protein [Pseudomonadota bacterium]
MKKFFLFAVIFLSGFSPSAGAEQYTVVGTDLPPLMYEKDHQPKGFYVDVLQAMIRNMKGIDIVIEFYPAPRMFKILSESKDTFSLGVARNEKRENLYNWVGPIYPRIFALYKLKTRIDLKIDKLEDVRSHTVGVGRGYAAVDDLLHAGIPPGNIQEVASDSLNIRKLFINRIDFIVMNDVMLAYRLEQSGHRWADIEQALILNDEYQFWYAFNKGIDDSVVQRFQEALDQLRQNGVHQAIVNNYFK